MAAIRSTSLSDFHLAFIHRYAILDIMFTEFGQLKRCTLIPEETVIKPYTLSPGIGLQHLAI